MWAASRAGRHARASMKRHGLASSLQTQLLNRGSVPLSRRAALVGQGALQRSFATNSSSSSSTPTLAEFKQQQKVAAATVAVVGASALAYFVSSKQRKRSEAKKEKQKEAEQEQQLKERLAAELLAAEPKQQGTSPSADWKTTLENVVPAIVSLKLNSPKCFDTESPGNASATGFVVDAERGIILTNRHVVGPGPIDAEAVFQNNEEVRVIPIYRDPVHDFGFFQFDPKDVKHMSVPSLPLAPAKAVIGTDIRVVGNDAAEKLAIASGTLARLDRDAPNYGGNNYNDFNTFYLQASSGTTGGSSGSPVLNSDGEAIALNAGGKIGTSASFYLPLDRVQRALELIQKDELVSRGTIQTIFQYKPFDELRRLGVSSETEKLVRSTSPNDTGMLVVNETIPKGPCSDKLEPGDVLVRVNGQLLTSFVTLESILDAHVDKEIQIQIERAGEVMEHTIQVQDLHAITPSKFLEIGGAVINPLSYQQARNSAMAPGAPYVADAGYFLQRSRVHRGAIIRSVNGEPTPDLETLEKVFSKCVDGQRVVLKLSNLRDKSEKVEVVHVDRRWFPFNSYERDDKLGVWHCTTHDPPFDADGKKEVIGSTSMLPGKNPVEAKLAKSLVTVDFDRPFSVNSLSTSNYRGTGLIVNADKGLVVVDRNTVTDSLGDAMVTFASTIVVPAHVIFVHPVHNFAIVQYDPQQIGTTPVESCSVSDIPIKPSDPAWLVGLVSSNAGRNGDADLVSRQTIVSGVKWLHLPPPSPPRYQEHNLEMVALQDVIRTDGGVVSNDDGDVQAFWGSFSYQQNRRGSKADVEFTRGIPIDLVMESARPLIDGKNPELWDIGVDFEQIALAKGRELGVSQEMADLLEKEGAHRRTILTVARRWGGSHASKVLQNGDILVEVDGKPVTSFREVEKRSQKPQVKLTIVRDGQQKEVEVDTVRLESTELNRIVFWQGLLVQPPPLSVSVQRSISQEDGIYVSCRYAGSPAARYGPPPTSRIKEIDGVKVNSVDEFLDVVKSKETNDSVRVKYTDLGGKDRLCTLKLEPKYWPTSELVLEEGEWHRRRV